ncbi:MAG: alkane 1-monooxygenase [Pseudomonadota bacterium]
MAREIRSSVSPVAVFALATLVPVPLLLGAAISGGVWVICACLYLTIFTYLLDELVGFASQSAPVGVEFPAAEWLSLLLGVIHLPIFALGVAALAGATDLSAAERVGVFLCFGIYMGQVLFSNAHELIHRSGKISFWLGMLVYSSAFYGHHVTAHRFIHHRYVGTKRDPNTARLGDGFWHFAIRAWYRAFWEGLAVERDRQHRKKHLLAQWWNIYAAYLGIALGGLALAWLSLGGPGIAALLALSLYSALQILLADYVQHYGLERRILSNGKPEPIGVAHSWNAPHPASAALMLNAPRHSDHHLNASKSFAMLELPDEAEAPMLPASLPAMSCVALFPPIWRKVMDPRARAWRDDKVDESNVMPIAAE